MHSEICKIHDPEFRKQVLDIYSSLNEGVPVQQLRKSYTDRKITNALEFIQRKSEELTLCDPLPNCKSDRIAWALSIDCQSSDMHKLGISEVDFEAWKQDLETEYITTICHE